jgi:ABC-type uncharacterized transport system permease subunit
MTGIKRARDPIIRIVKRGSMPFGKVFAFYAMAIAAALAAGGFFMALMGVNPFAYFYVVISGCFKTALSKISLVRIIVPLLITSLGIVLAFRMNFWNIGAEGQFIMGAVGASYIALNYGTLPHWLLIPLMAAAGILSGGLWGYAAAFFRCRFGTNETLLTLMLNYIALYIIQYLRDGPWRDPAAGGFPKITKFPENAWIYKLGGLDISWIIALLLVIIIYAYLKYTKQGYEISVVGDSTDTARYAGMNNGRIIRRTMFFSASVAGLAGMLQVAGDATSHTLSMGIASGVGFTAIIVAWLAKLNPFGILAVSVLFGMLEKGCGVAESTFGISSSVSDILQGIILFVILGADFFVRYKPVVKKREVQTK